MSDDTIYEIRVDRELLEKLVTVDQMIGISEDNLRIVVEVMSNFVVNPSTGTFFSYEKGRKILGAMKLKELRTVATGFGQKVVDAAVSP